MRVDRGGSWLYPAWLLRSATRERNPADFPDRIMGFRVARTLPQCNMGLDFGRRISPGTLTQVW